MEYRRPTFNIFNTWKIRKRQKLRRALSAAEKDYRNFLQNTVAPAQCSWVASVVELFASELPWLGEMLKGFADKPRAPGPEIGPINLILEDSPMYVYCSVEEMKSYANRGSYDGFSSRGVVICTVPPYAEEVTRGAMSVWQNQTCANTCSGKKDLAAYIAFLPTHSLLNSNYWHMSNGTYSFLAPSQKDTFSCEIFAVGRALFAGSTLAEKSKKWLSNFVKNYLKSSLQWRTVPVAQYRRLQERDFEKPDHII
uniref:5 protein n=1 Tax=Agrobacterium vitis TaxID=373 RepID=Q9X5L0_AGRVI|nr:5 protein [Agrobacterium vitis]